MTGWVEDGLLTSDDVAGLLQVRNGRAVDRLRRAGRLVGVRVGRSWRYTRDDVDAFVQRHRGVSEAVVLDVQVTAEEAEAIRRGFIRSASVGPIRALS